MGILLSIGSWIGGNWKIVGIALGAIFLYWKIAHEWNDYQDWKAEQAQTITELTVSRDRAIVERASAQAAMAEKEAHILELNILLEKTLEEQAFIHEEAKRQKEQFEGHDLAKMAQRHGQWVEKIINKGTQEKLDDIEAAFNQ